MKVDQAVLLALREVADPSCRRCYGAGVTSRDIIQGLCRCVAERLASEDKGADLPPTDEMPHPWPIITRRAQQIHASALLGTPPDNWTG